MSYLSDNWYWMVTAAASGGALLWLNVRNSGTGLSPQEVVMLMNREKAQVIDVSPESEYKGGHVKGARHMALSQITDGAKGLPGNKQTPVVVVCASGAQAGKAANSLRQLGYERAQILRGGMRAWREAQLPTESSAA